MVVGHLVALAYQVVAVVVEHLVALAYLEVVEVVAEHQVVLERLEEVVVEVEHPLHLEEVGVEVEYLFLLVVGSHGEDVALQVQADLLLPEAGQVGLQQEVVALVPDVGAEGGGALGALGKEETGNIIKEVIHVVGIFLKGDQAIHKS